MKLLVGLGNPGKQYARNRHNIGFMAVEDIAKAYNFTPWQARFKGQFSQGNIENQKCLLLKPETYMNLSGEAVRQAAQFYKIPLEDIIVLHDEIDLAPAKIKVKTGGGNAGHNGLKSISAHMGNDYTRVRLGVGRPQDKADVANYVLHDFAKSEQAWLDDVIDAISRYSALLVKGEYNDFMSKVGQNHPESQQQNKSSSKSSKTKKDNKEKEKQIVSKKTKSEPTNNETKTKGPLGAALEKWLGSNPNSKPKQGDK